MIPIGDENPSRIKPIINWGIIITCIAVFLWQSTRGQGFFEWTLYTYGIIPVKAFSGESSYSFVTNIFLHGGWSHLFGNMLFLFVFGDNVEDRLGHLRYILFYLICGIGASAVWMVTDLNSVIPAVGASGAISGILGAYFVLYPYARIRALMSFGYFIRVVRVRAWVMIGFWFLYQLVLSFLPYNTGVAYWAHVGGFVIGWIFSRFFKQRYENPSNS
ncbi:rhomboid family intramembrane serine protease [Thermoproteota archaeon]